MALPSLYDVDQYIHPSLVPAQVRNLSIAHQICNLASVGLAGRLPHCLLHPASVHVQAAIQNVAPSGAPTVFQGLVLLLHPSGAVQHQHGIRCLFIGPPALSCLEAPVAGKEACGCDSSVHTWNSVSHDGAFWGRAWITDSASASVVAAYKLAIFVVEMRRYTHINPLCRLSRPPLPSHSCFSTLV